MNYQSEFLNVVQDIANSPKTLALTGSFTAGLSFANAAQIVQGWLSSSGILLGVIATGLLIRLHWINYKNAVIQNKILLRQQVEMDEKDK